MARMLYAVLICTDEGCAEVAFPRVTPHVQLRDAA
jgi:hypothetical protein